jgi:ubiquinone/menaquinone biosynthesis C-methylase UbiE
VSKPFKVLFWQRILSYFTDLTLEESFKSAHNPFLKVVLRRGRFQLCTENAIYSYGDLYDNFSKTFDKLDFEALNIQKVLVLGLGLGSIPLMLEKTFKKKFSYTAVEIDAEVLRLAHAYGMNNLQSPISFHHADAQTFCSFSEETFDLICMDVFIDDVVPTELEKEAFLLDLRRLLSPNGVVLFNKLSLLEKDKHQAASFFHNHFRRVFPEATSLDVGGNHILISASRCLLK